MEKTKKKAIIILEYDHFLVKVYKKKLEDEGYMVDYLRNGLGVVEEVKKIHPDLIIIDLIMPEKDGFWAIKELKNDPQTSKIPILTLSKLDDRLTEMELGELGVVKHMATGNYSFKEVVVEVKKII